ncbi:MAG: hypothetical protein M5R37_05035 [Melioribacteraceae bacterium]|nr:hypothetical protein [Melioribacteraceae bacterium]
MKKFIQTILFLCIISSSIFSQDLDSLYHKLFTSINYSKAADEISSGKVETIKCGMYIVNELKENFEKLSPEQKNNLSFLQMRPQTETSIISPSGYFRIHYNTTGVHAPGYNLNELSIALDSTKKFEIDFLGYPEPPNDNGEGGDNLYDVYIQDLGSIYGYTDFVSTSNSPSFMVIDNDFNIHYTKGIDGAKVTVAHEFHHAIQVGSYLYRSNDSFFYEMLSTSMEEFVFDTINDYYDYIPNYYNNAQAPFYATYGGGYDLAIWNIFLKEKYGYDVIKRSLENVVNHSALESIANSIAEFGGSFKSDFAEFGVWNYFTGSRTKRGKYFDEAEYYPHIKPVMSINFNPSSEMVMVNSNPVSNNYLRFVDVSRGLPDTLVAIVTNNDYQSTSRTEFNYYLYNYSAEGSTNINDLYWSKITSNKKSIFSETVIFNNELAVEGNTERVEVDFAFPQPFNYNKHAFLYIPTSKDISGKSFLNIYTTSMDLVFSDEKDIFATDKIVVRWDGKKSNGEKLPTGVYIYVTKSGDIIKKGKLVIYNE